MMLVSKRSPGGLALMSLLLAGGVYGSTPDQPKLYDGSVDWAPKKKPREKTEHDWARIDRAEEKRRRKAEKRSKA